MNSSLKLVLLFVLAALALPLRAHAQGETGQNVAVGEPCETFPPAVVWGRASFPREVTEEAPGGTEAFPPPVVHGKTRFAREVKPAAYAAGEPFPPEVKWTGRRTVVAERVREE